MTGGHLGERAAALVDGELGVAAREAALAHLARCDACRAEVAAQRRLKSRLGQLGEPAPPPALGQRLAAIGGADVPGGQPYPPGPATGRTVPAGSPERGSPHVVAAVAGGGPVVDRPRGRLRPPLPAVRRPAGRRPGGSRRRGVRIAVAGGASLVALGVSAFLAGGSSAGPAVVPDVDRLSVEHASTTGEVPFEVPLPGPVAGVLQQVSAP